MKLVRRILCMKKFKAIQWLNNKCRKLNNWTEDLSRESIAGWKNFFLIKMPAKMQIGRLLLLNQSNEKSACLQSNLFEVNPPKKFFSVFCVWNDLPFKLSAKIFFLSENIKIEQLLNSIHVYCMASSSLCNFCDLSLQASEWKLSGKSYATYQHVCIVWVKKLTSTEKIMIILKCERNANFTLQ